LHPDLLQDGGGKGCLTGSDTLFLLGDYIDRGPDSKGVIDYIISLQKRSYRVVPLMGNHEIMFITAVHSNAFFDLWMLNNGNTTLRDFGIYDQTSFRVMKKIPVTYLDYVSGLRYWEETHGFVLVHAGLDPYAEDPLRNSDFLLWDRTGSINERFMGDRTLIHGHTPRPLGEIWYEVNNHRSKCICLDGGCVYNHHPSLGNLTGLDLDTRELYHCKNVE